MITSILIVCYAAAFFLDFLPMRRSVGKREQWVYLVLLLSTLGLLLFQLYYPGRFTVFGSFMDLLANLSPEPV